MTQSHVWLKIINSPMETINVAPMGPVIFERAPLSIDYSGRDKTTPPPLP